MAKSNINIESATAKSALEKMKNEVAGELGIDLSDSKLTAKQAGRVGGNMTKKLVEMAEQNLNR